MTVFTRLVVFSIIGLLAGCATMLGDEGDDRAFRRAAPSTFSVRPDNAQVQTVQLYRTGRETNLPIINFRSGQTLTLEFDLLDDGMGSPVSVFFYHMDRNWEQKLMTVEYLRGFQSDDIRDYEPSAGTRIRYTHYTYQFPNQTIAFTRSGNFLLRVTEPGDERAVLFERPFFISEEIAEVELTVQSGLAAGLGSSLLQPVAQVRPASEYDSPIFEHNVCFARNGRVETYHCSDEFRLLGASYYQFFLPRDRAFGASAPMYDLDLSFLGVGPRIAEIDLGRSPFRVILHSDDARFSSAFFREELLAGQSSVRDAVQTGFRPQVDAEYVETTFTYIPPDRGPLEGRVTLVGSFRGWSVDPTYSLEWYPEDGVYRGTFYIKQGRHVYSYHVEDPEELERRARATEAGMATLYTSFVYLYDPTYDTDRLVGVRNVFGQ